MQPAITIHHIEPFRALDVAGIVAGIWCQANDLTEEDARLFLAGTFPKHVWWPQFSLYLAMIEGNPVGFIYGYRSEPGQWWHDQVASVLRSSDLGWWLENSVELAEVAVLPQFQHRGIGSMLIEAYLANHGNPVLLAMEAADESTHRLYRAHGFIDLITNYRYPDWPDDPMIIMGREIPEDTHP